MGRVDIDAKEKRREETKTSKVGKCHLTWRNIGLHMSRVIKMSILLSNY